MRENTKTLFVASEDIAAALELLENIEVEIGFDSDDPESIEDAILAVEDEINTRLVRYRGDTRIESAILRVKSDFRCAILDQALQDDDNEEAFSIVDTLH
jgi:DNA-dependent RNA polymerase auxiliary subunit epsilon